MNTLVNEGRRMPYTNSGSATLASGAVVAVGDIVGIVVADIAAGEDGQLELQGVHLLAKASGAIAQGEQLYWDASPGNLTTASTGNTKAGVAWAAAATAATTAYVLLNVNT